MEVNEACTKREIRMLKKHLTSHSPQALVARYIANQEEHHRKRTYTEGPGCSLGGMDWNGNPIKTIEMVAGPLKGR